jgi:hypothetical protein
MTASLSASPGMRRFLDGWHRAECLVAVAAFGFIAIILIVDVWAGSSSARFPALGMNLGPPACRLAAHVGVCAGGRQFCGIGIATPPQPSGAAGGLRLIPTPKFRDRLADLLRGSCRGHLVRLEFVHPR